MATGNKPPASQQSDDCSLFPWFRKREQIFWAVGMTVMLLILTWHLYIARWQGPKLIDIDLAPPIQYRFVIDINSADWPELTLLPGISETYARRIVEFRNANGPFQSVEDLLMVQGIGPKRLQAMREFLQVGSSEDFVVPDVENETETPDG